MSTEPVVHAVDAPPERRASVLLVEDEPGIRGAVRDFLGVHGCQVLEADSCRAAERLLCECRPDLAILDHQLPDGNGLELLARLREIAPSVPTMILTAHGSIELAVRAMQLGAEQFLTKPVNLHALLAVLDRMLENARTRRESLAGEVRRGRLDLDPFTGDSAAIRALEESTRLALRSPSPVLLLGETGSGKGVLASWLHRHGPRAGEAFVELNGAGLSRELLESELFGHERGAFTGAVTEKQGLLEVAHHGTVFLDEIGDMDLVVQAKLLKVIEDRRIRRVGSVRDRLVDVRILAATHRDLAVMVRDERFRPDLYYRLGVFVLRLPPLRERREDVPHLAERMLAALAREMGRAPLALSPDAAAALAARPWPGNLRELRNTLERAILGCEGPVLTTAALPKDPGGGPSPARAGEPDDELTLEEIQRRHILRALELEQGHVGRAADRLGLARSTLYQRLRELRIAVGRESSEQDTTAPRRGP